MATKLTKLVSREVGEWGATNGREARRAMIVSLNPAGFISFRPKGTRTDYDLDIASAYSLAVKRHAGKEAQAKAMEKEKRKQGLA